jgi:hypothetical protein
MSFIRDLLKKLEETKRAAAHKTTANATPAQRQQQDTLTEIQRWMLVEFVERQTIVLDYGPDVEIGDSGPNGIYQEILQELRAAAADFNTVRQSLTQLVANDDGVDAIITKSLEDQKDRSLKTMARMAVVEAQRESWTAQNIPRKNDEMLELFFTVNENRIARILLIRAWSRAFVDFQSGFIATITLLISDLMLQQQRSTSRMLSMKTLFNTTRDLAPLAAQYQGIRARIRSGG